MAVSPRREEMCEGCGMVEKNIVGRLREQKLKNHEVIIDACRRADWGQVIANGGPPCFYLDGDTFCLRAERWAGHNRNGFHAFTPLDDLVRQCIK